MTEPRTNPESNNAIPVVGREAIYARLQQHVLDPPHRQATIFTGHDGIGKTALLQYFPHLFDNQILGVYISLANAPFQSNEAWVDYLIARTNQMLEEHDFTVERVTDIESETNEESDWFKDIYLFEVMHLIRPQRRIVWLLDDIEYLLDALPEQMQYLHDLLQTHLQLSIVLTLHTEYEDRIRELAPLATMATSERLHRLSIADSAELIRHYAPGTSDDMASTIYDITGGHPRLLSNFGYELNKSWATHGDSEALQIAKPAAYALSDTHLRQIWKRLTQNESIVATAIANLIYADPLRNVTVEHIEAWLVETDYPLDVTAIHAALRGLEYQDIVTYQRHEGYKVVAGMMQTWLLEYARLDNLRGDSTSGFSIGLSKRTILIVIIIIIILTLILFSLPTPTHSPSDPLPTVTLSSQ